MGTLLRLSPYQLSYFYRIRLIKEDRVDLDGTEQEIFSTTSPGIYLGWIDLRELGAGDEVTIRMYVKPYYNSDWGKVDEMSLSGPLDRAVKPIARTVVVYGLKLTLQQTAGTYRTVYYQILREE